MKNRIIISKCLEVFFTGLFPAIFTILCTKISRNVVFVSFCGVLGGPVGWYIYYSCKKMSNGSLIGFKSLKNIALDYMYPGILTATIFGLLFIIESYFIAEDSIKGIWLPFLLFTESLIVYVLYQISEPNTESTLISRVLTFLLFIIVSSSIISVAIMCPLSLVQLVSYFSDKKFFSTPPFLSQAIFGCTNNVMTTVCVFSTIYYINMIIIGVVYEYKTIQFRKIFNTTTKFLAGEW